ncbi:MAG: hypothetical protein V1696_04090 [Candidatus Jorgensenbacteria bacterium]
MNIIILQKLNKKILLWLAVVLIAVIAFAYSRNNTTNEVVVWEQSNTGLTTLTVNTIAADTSNQSILYAGTDTGIFKSVDKGASWTAINNGLPNPLPAIREIIHAPFSKAVFALGWGDLFESLDGGNNWILIGAYVDDIALKPSSIDAGFGEKVYILKDSLALRKNPIIYSISTGIGFFSEPQQKTRMEINSFYEHLYKDQNEINKDNREEVSKLLGKIIKDDDTSYDVVKATEIDFLRKEEKTLPNGTLNIGESIISLLSQNSVFTWLQTDRTVYFCWEDFQNCEEDSALQSILEKETKNLRPLGSANTSYSQVGVPHIYVNPDGFSSAWDKLLIKPCLRTGQWILNNSLSKLGFTLTHIFVYSHFDQSFSSACDEKTQDKQEFLEDVIFAVAKDKGYSSNFLLVSKDNAKTWEALKGNLPTSIKSLFVSEIGNGYNLYITTADNGIFKASISFKDLR